MQLENAILFGDCLDLLPQIPDDTFHAVVTDAPYGLGARGPTPEEILLFVQDTGSTRGQKDFMGQEWDFPSVAVWKQIYRVLKPGGHVLCFGGTRTFDLISLGLRLAGFDNRDTIADFGCLQWVYGQGMPKSHNVSKMLAKKGRRTEAKLWEGRGTGLKPSWEPVVVFRKPFSGTVVDNLLKHGTGVLNIDGCRVRHTSESDFEALKAQVEAIKAKGGVRGNSWKNASDLSGASDVTEAGRWPPNVTLAHHPGCKVVGFRKVKAPILTRFDDGAKPFGGGAGHPYTTTQTGDTEGKEEVPIWECVEGCPINDLDEQNREKPSRFFEQFQAVHVPFQYVAKPSKKEANLEGDINNDHLTKKPLGLMRWLVRLVTFKGAHILDPYCGSGSTLHAAAEEGVTYTGIERDEHSYEIAVQRMDIVLGREQERQIQMAAFDLAMELDDEDDDS